MKGNIWVINQFAGTPENGWGERHYFFATNWLQSGYKVNIISGSFNHVFNKLPDAPEKYNIEDYKGRNFCWVKTPHYKGESIMRFWSMLVFAWRVLFVPVSKIGKPDVIIVSSMPIFPILTGYLLKRKYKASKLIFEIRDIWPLTAIFLGNLSKYHPFILFMSWFERFGYKKSDYIVTLLPNAGKHINPISKNPAKLVYIPNGLSESELENVVLEEDIINAIPKNKFIVGYTGTLGKANALEFLVESAKTLMTHKQIHFVIVGDGYLKPQLMESAKNLDNITFIRKIKKNQVQNILQLFDVCFVGRNNSPLFEHGVSANKFFDYMLAGKPILDSNNLIKDPVELSGCGLVVKPDSSEAITEGVLTLFNMSKDQLSTLGAKGHKYLLENHTIKILSDRYIKLFKTDSPEKITGKPKKILFILDWYPPSSMATATRFESIINAVSGIDNCETTILTDNISKNKPFVKSNFFSSPANSSSLYLRIIQEILLGAELMLKIIFRNVDLVYVSSPPFITSVLCVLGCRLSNKKYIFEVRDLYPEVYVHAGLINQNGWFYRLIKKLEKYCYRHAQVNITVSDVFSNEMSEKTGSQKISIVENGYSEKNFKPSIEKYDKFTVVFHGNIGRFQKPELIIQVAEIVHKIDPAITFLIIGDGPKDTIIKKAKTENISFLGRLDNKTTAETIARCHLGISFRTDDNISLKSIPVRIYEYLGVKIPVIVTPFNSEGAKLVDKLKTGLRFTNDDAEAIANTVIRLKENKEMYAELVQHIELVRTNFTRELQAEKLKSIISKHLFADKA